MHLYYCYYNNNNNNNDTLFFTVSWLGYGIPLRCLQYFPLVFKLEVFYETPYCHLSFKLFSFILNCYTVLYNVYKLTHQQNILYLHVITTDQTMFVGVVRYEYQFFLVCGQFIKLLVLSEILWVIYIVSDFKESVHASTCIRFLLK